MTADYKALIERIADNICTRGLASPAIFFLELHKPLFGLVREILVVSSPVMGVIFGRDFRNFMDGVFESPERIEELIVLIEEKSKPLEQKNAGC